MAIRPLVVTAVVAGLGCTGFALAQTAATAVSATAAVTAAPVTSTAAPTPVTLSSPAAASSTAAPGSKNAAPGPAGVEGTTALAEEKAAEAAAIAFKNVSADQTEFQRFVLESTGKPLGLFGYNLFNSPGQYAPVLAAPVPSSYLLGPGDELVVQTYGMADMAERMVLDREGKVYVPKVGPLVLAGMPFAEAEKALTAHIGKVFSNFTLSLAMSRVRSIEVFVVGQARRPGKQIVSGLSTLINALFETGGPSNNGSMRAVQLRRGGKTIATVDLYQFLAQGDTAGDVKLQSGDIVVIPPAGPRAALLGTLNAPAIYELKAGESIQDLLNLSGGLPALAAPQKAQLERLNAQRDVPRYVEDFALDAAGLKRELQAGDVLTVFQISPQIANVVTLEGNVAAPMRYSFKPGMKVADLLGDPRLLIPTSYWQNLNRGANTSNPSRPEVNLDYAVVQRLDPATLRTRLIAFNPAKALALDPTENIALVSGDILTIYKPNDAGPETDNSIALSGEIVGGLRRFVWRPGLTLRDLIPSTQWLVDYYNFWQRPNANSLRSDINWEYAQIVRRVPSTLRTRTLTFNLGEQVLGKHTAPPLQLEPGDEIALYTTAQVAVPVEKRYQQVVLGGEVNVPGTYQIQPGETLQQLVQRAGGLTRNAFLYGATFTRESTRQQQQDNLDKAIRRAEVEANNQTSTLLQNQTSNNQNAVQGQLYLAQQELARLRSLRANGRLALEIGPTAGQLPHIKLENGDRINIPTSPDFVGVQGAVLAEAAFLYRPGNTVDQYLDRAGLTRDADLDHLMVIRANGTVESAAREGRRTLWGLGSGLAGSTLYPGDTVFVPEKIDRRTAYSRFIEGAKDWTAIFYQFGLGAAGLKTLQNN